MKKIVFMTLLLCSYAYAKNAKLLDLNSLNSDATIFLSEKAKEIRKKKSLYSDYTVTFNNKPYLKWGNVGDRIRVNSPINKINKIYGKITKITKNEVTISFNSISNLFENTLMTVQLEAHKENLYKVPLKAIYNPSGTAPRLLREIEDNLFEEVEVEIVKLDGESLLIYYPKEIKTIATTRLLFVNKKY